jgi:hypothetical protein
VTYFLVSKLPVIYKPLLSSYLYLSKNIGKNNTTPDKFVVKATCIESTGLPCSLVTRLILHFVHHLMEVRWAFGECQFHPLSATWHSSAQRGTAKECCGLSSAKAFNGQVMEM